MSLEDERTYKPQNNNETRLKFCCPESQCMGPNWDGRTCQNCGTTCKTCNNYKRNPKIKEYLENTVNCPRCGKLTFNLERCFCTHCDLGLSSCFTVIDRTPDGFQICKDCGVCFEDGDPLECGCYPKKLGDGAKIVCIEVGEYIDGRMQYYNEHYCLKCFEKLKKDKFPTIYK